MNSNKVALNVFMMISLNSFLNCSLELQKDVVTAGELGPFFFRWKESD